MRFVSSLMRLACLLILAALWALPAMASEDAEVSIIFSANNFGAYKPCPT